MFQTREQFIAYATARYITHLPHATATEYQNAVVIAMSLANKLELMNVAPWPRDTWAVMPQGAQQALPVQNQIIPQAQTPSGSPPSATGQHAQVPGVDNMELLRAANPHLFPKEGQSGGVVGQDPPPKAGSAAHPVGPGAIIAAHGEVQGNRETVMGPTITTPGIVSDIKPVHQPGVIEGVKVPTVQLGGRIPEG
jgi:hypothetical protein